MVFLLGFTMALSRSPVLVGRASCEGLWQTSNKGLTPALQLTELEQHTNCTAQRMLPGRRGCTQNNKSTARLRGLLARFVAAVAELGSLGRMRASRQIHRQST